MKKHIWKYELCGNGYQQIDMPVGAEILTVQVKDGKPCIWALCTPSNATETRRFLIVGTGWEINYDEDNIKKHIGTFQIGKVIIYHVFELIGKELGGR